MQPLLDYSSSNANAVQLNKGLKTAPENINMKEKLVDFDQVFDFIKHYGRYQFFMLVVIQYIMLNSAGNYIFIAFATLKPSCGTRQIQVQEDVCARIAECSSNVTSVFHSLYEEEGFVCPQEHLPQHMQTLQAIGSGIGAIVGGHLADTFGRKWITYIGALNMCAFGLMGALSVNWVMLAVAMFGMGLAYGALVDSSMTLASETVGPRHRIVQTLAFQWSLSVQIASFLAYLTVDWRSYLVSINALCLPVLLLMLLWRESPRWLIQKRRHEEACEELNAISSWNGCAIRFKAEDLSNIQLNNGGDKCKIYSLWDLFATKKLALYSMVMIFSALTVEMSVGVVLFDVQILVGNPFLNVALYGLLRIWVPVFIILIEARSAWFATTVICYTLVTLLLIVASSSEQESTLFAILRTVLSLLGGIMNSGMFFTIYKQYSIELYPTLMRAMAVGAFGVVERIGGALAPQLITMNTWAWQVVHCVRVIYKKAFQKIKDDVAVFTMVTLIPQLAAAFQGSAITVTTALSLASLVAGYITLPETRGESMPDVHVDNNNNRSNREEAM